jgi:hypothetical protein
MPYAWPKDTDFALWELDVLDRNCPVCGRMMYVCDHRYRRFHTLNGNTVEIGASHSLLLPCVCEQPGQQGGCDSHASRTMCIAS